ncbi:helix-turn-helix domain-containing protein [Desulfomonile tiedjei]|uniref:DNA-binding protein, excisionase family n=1 Tax=Desulfomonile tiedjei (strain ATCC 49306 / DSM 6799 / DCB-1) TaxID=706587 RepID=I4CDU3_DESTA|nr:helix-turn-helix domain-containing protein [Desulfomonile tiedjei]AFM27734.1 DNA-binding protein, excisionase family [Desulfomonile tiedjei DSM 6799]
MNSEGRRENDNDQIGIQRLLSPKEVADILGISVKTVHKLVRDQRLACVQVTSKEKRFTQEQVQEFVRSRTIERPIDRKDLRPVNFPRKGGEKSLGFARTALKQEMQSWR